MARLPRLYVPGQAQLVHASFSSTLLSHDEGLLPETLDELMGWIRDESARRKVQIHGFSISAFGLCLLATPSDPLGLPQVMQSLGRNLAAKLRIGTVFNGRYRSAIPEPNAWTLPTLIWIERRVQQAQPHPDPESWRWSSCSTHTGISLHPFPWIAFHKDYWALGNTPFDRQARYRAMVTEGNSRSQNLDIEQALRGQWALGSQSFISTLEPTANRRLQPGQRGRPRKKTGQDGA